jgi:hypothetical protein
MLGRLVTGVVIMAGFVGCLRTSMDNCGGIVGNFLS